MNPPPTVSAIVPARNEESTIDAAVESLAAQAEIKEIFAVDDESSDGTAERLRQLAQRFPQLQVIEAGALPDGWVGKNYAASLGAARATGEWLLFTDADGVVLPGAVTRGLVEAAATGASLVSYSAEQVLHHWWERALITFIYTRLGQKYSYDNVNDPGSAAAAASGLYLLIRRADYERLGGHAAIKGEVIEDVALAKRVKGSGLRLHFASGAGIARVRMYQNFRAMWQGWLKNLYPLMGGSPRAVGRELRAVVPWIPLGLLLLAPVHPVLGVLGAALLAGRHAAYAAALRRNRFPVSRVLYYMPGAVLYAAALLASEWRYGRGRVAWKGREVRVNSPGR